MKRINGLVLSALTAAFLVGCGGGGGGSSSSPINTTTDITVERGPLWGATVTDATGKPAKQKVSDSNIYTFDSAVTYPVKAVGGIIDIDGDSSTTDDIFDFTGKELISYTNFITPITNYLGDITSEAGKAKLAKLESLGLTKDELVNNVASKATTKKAEMISLTNALFELMNDDNPNNDDLINETNYSSFKNRFDTFVSMVKDDVAINASASSQALEETVLKGILEKYSEADGKSKIDEIKASLFTLTQAMISGKRIGISDEIGTATFEFKTNGDYFDSYNDNDGSTGSCTGTWKMGTIKNTIEIVGSCTDNEPANGSITFNEEPKVGSTFKIVDEEEMITIDSFDNISEGTNPTEPTTTSFVSGKTVIVGDTEGDMTVIFGTDGTYSESGPDSEGGTYSCSGKWADLGNNKIGVTCQDNGTDEIPDGVIDANSNEITVEFSSSSPTVNTEVTVTDADGSYPMTIKNISDIAK